jgi:hypothetical protein
VPVQLTSGHKDGAELCCRLVMGPSHLQRRGDGVVPHHLQGGRFGGQRETRGRERESTDITIPFSSARFFSTLFFFAVVRPWLSRFGGQFDADGNGCVTTEELGTVFKKLGEKVEGASAAAERAWEGLLRFSRML